MPGSQPPGPAQQRRAHLAAAAPGDADPLLTLPNLLTLSRVPLGFLFGLVARSTAASFAVIGVAGITDVLDGWLARRGRGDSQVVAGPTGRGAWLDPLCDKFFLIAVLLSIYVTRRPPAHLLVMIATRELLQAPLTAAYRVGSLMGHGVRFDFRSNPVGKLATITQFVAVGAVLVRHAAAPVLAAVAAGVGAAAVASYVRRAITGR